MKIELLETHTVYKGPVFSVRQDLMRLPDNNQVWIDVVDHRDSVTILPVDNLGQIWFIRQYRQPIGKPLLELPAGVCEEGEIPQQSALRELREEIGMAAQEMVELGSFFLAPGYSSEFMRVFLARELYSSPLPSDIDEILQVERIPAREAYSLAETGGLPDSKSLITLFWAKPLLTRLGFLS